MQSFLENLLGGGQQRREYQDFVNRYQQGPPWEGYSDRETLDRYNHVARQLPPDVYEQSAEQAFERLSPEERMEFARWLRTRAQQENVRIPDLDQDDRDDRFQDPRVLARAASRMQQQEPDLLTKILGGQSGTVLDNPLAKAALAGIAAMAAQRILGGRR